MVELKVKVSKSELDALEDFIVAWNLCKKHNATINATEDEYWKFTQTCKACEKINKEIRNKSLHLWSRLVTSYLKKTEKNYARNHKL